jgi:hypothetical protein
VVRFICYTRGWLLTVTAVPVFHGGSRLDHPRVDQRLLPV